MSKPTEERFLEHDPAPLESQIYSQYLNFFSLEASQANSSISSLKLYRKPLEESQAPETFLEHENYSLRLNPADGYEEFAPDSRILKRILLRLFGDRLRSTGYRFRSTYIVFHPDDEILQPHKDVFSVFSGFEYRIQSFAEKFFLIPDPHLVFRFRKNLQELVQLGLPQEYAQTLAVRVIESEQGGRTARIDAYVIAVCRDGDALKCEVRDCRDLSEKVVDADKVILEPRPEVIGEVLQYIGRAFDVVKLQREKSFLSSSRASADRFAKTLEIIDSLRSGRRAVFPILQGEIRVDLRATPLPVRGSGFPQGMAAGEPDLLFDKSDSSSMHKQAYWGLRNFGPYQKDTPEVRLALLATRQDMPRLEALVTQLNAGTQSMPGGMGRFFRTILRVIHKVEVVSYDLKSLEGTLDEFLRSGYSEAIDTLLGMLPTKTDEFQLETPYYVIKAVLAKKGITSQMVTPACLGNLKWNALNLGTAIFSKAGATPWVLGKAFPDFDMIVGFGLSTLISRTRRAGNNPKFIGAANVFDTNGRWMFFEGTEREQTTENRVEQIRELFDGALKKYKAEKGGFPQRVAVHYYKRFAQTERDVIRQLLAGRANNFQLAYVSIDDSHPYRAYDKTSKEGDFPRGGIVKLGDHQFLLCTSGQSQYAGRRMGTPRILNISFWQEPKEFTTVENIADHVLALTKLNYQTVTPLVREPVTLLFANRIANFAAAMSGEEYRSLVKIFSSSNFKAKLWFL